MTEVSNKRKYISKTGTGFPEYLDFDQLRSHGIDYLGQLAGKIWTDHNVHDPGITILEILIYALMDLGYRTNLPIEDLLAQAPGTSGPDNNFLTPAQILTNNPLTIIDYRKMLVDIDGVKNAWLEIADDATNFCDSNQSVSSLDCLHYLNGIYSVKIDLEKNLEQEFPNPADRQRYEDELRASIRGKLMEHRNLCEDFKDITFLCKIELGVCAEIELDPGAEVEVVYLEIMEKLRAFFSPNPRFYTLPQLLDRNTPIEEIFAGRPYNLEQSHGFVDTSEFEQLRLKKEIHLSDVYKVIFQVPGVKAVKKLRLHHCKDGNIIDAWKFELPKDHVPDFSVACSGFKFFHQGMPLNADLDQFNQLLALKFSNNGKILYQMPSPNLDSEIPKGIYRPDLGAYNSIQTEFPAIYGIGEGDLSDDAPDIRKAQSLQLKGYLLFFDQLLANYLAQLQHIRQLFAFKNPSEGDHHSYFAKELTNVPEIEKLLRFKASEQNNLPNSGTTLVVPISHSLLPDQNLKLETIKPFKFESAKQRDILIQQWIDDLYYQNYRVEFVTTRDDCVYYYLIGTSQHLALISTRYFGSEQEAAQVASTLQYVGTFPENYRRTNTSGGRSFSFNLEMNVSGYLEYLQKITEDQDTFLTRRNEFLDHLLSRFAESFTDFAMLSYGQHQPEALEHLNLWQKERYLSHFPDLSSNRGRG